MKVVREAVDIGIADIAAGRFRDFDTAKSLHDHLSTLVEEALRSADTDGD